MLEHVWWNYLTAWGYKTAHMRMECGHGQRLVRYWLETGYCRLAAYSDPDQKHIEACCICNLFGNVCQGDLNLVVDVERALAVSEQRIGPLDISSLPICFDIEIPRIETTSDRTMAIEI